MFGSTVSRLFTIASIFLLAVIVVACSTATPQPEITPETVEVQVDVPVEVTRIVEVEGETVVETETIIVTATPEPVATAVPASEENPVELHVGVSLNAEELQVWLPLFNALDEAHPEWFLVLEQTPQASVNEKMNANAAAGTLPCVQEVQGLFINPFIRQGAFIPLNDLIAQYELPMDDFWPEVMVEWQYQGQSYGIPLVAAPEMLYFNKAMFDAAGMDYPTDAWTFDDLREAAIQLTLDNQGRNPTDPDFDPANIQQWGFNASPSSLSFWAHVYVEPWGGSFCANEDCTQVSMDDPENMEALQFWYDLVVTNHAGLYDPFSGAQTGVPGDPFIAERAALGYDGFFAIGVINATAQFPFGVRQPPEGPAGRSSALSTRGYAIATNCAYPEEAFKLIQELTGTDFLNQMWTQSGFSVPSRRSAAQTLLETDLDGADSVLATMEYAHGFRPNGPGAFEAYNQTLGIAKDVFAGARDLAEGYAEIEETANTILTTAAESQQ